VQTISDAPHRAHHRAGPVWPLSKMTFRAPVVRGKVNAVALNYRSHAGMSGGARPELFAKLPSAVVGPDQAIVLPALASGVHFEGEMVAVIGKRARNVSAAEALAYIFGITAGNDVSARNWQAGDLQWLRAKSSDSLAPLGPILVRRLNHDDLRITTRVNGVVMQDKRTKYLIHDVAAMISISAGPSLNPGDVIYTGTPVQTSALKPGDVVGVKIEGVGVPRNPAQAE
jgi:2-keto-4-pentenoate hydratase/2-oxohepta-3-ene-1,7-dioic acid hydratase in catechol pathway